MIASLCLHATSQLGHISVLVLFYNAKQGGLLSKKASVPGTWCKNFSSYIPVGCVATNSASFKEKKHALQGSTCAFAQPQKVERATATTITSKPGCSVWQETPCTFRLNINAFAFATRKKCLGVLEVFIFFTDVRSNISEPYECLHVVGFESMPLA